METIQEFLISLGFNVDSEGMRRFEDALTGTRKAAIDLGLAFAATGAAVVAETARMARQYQDLYYASERIGDSIANVNAFRFAAAQMGDTSGTMASQMEAFMATARQQPWVIAQELALGVDITRKPVERFEQYMDRLAGLMRSGQTMQAEWLAGQRGISDQFLVFWTHHGEEVKEQQKWWEELYRRAGISQEQFGKDSRQFWKELGQVEAFFGIIAVDTAEKTMGWFHGLFPLMKQAGDFFVDLDNKASHWLGTLTGIGTAALGVDALTHALAKLTGLSIGTGAFAFLIKRLLPWTAMLGLTGPAGSEQKLGEPPPPMSEEDRERLKNDPALRLWNKLENWWSGSKADQGKSIQEWFEQQGWSPQASAGIAQRLRMESGFDPKAVGDSGDAYGIGQWHADRQALFRKLFGKDIHASTLDEQLQFVNWELAHSERRAGAALRGAQTPEDAYSIFTRQYERPKDPFADFSSAKLGARKLYQHSSYAPSVNQNITMNIQGGNAQDVAHAVLDGQERINSNVVRYLKSPVQ